MLEARRSHRSPGFSGIALPYGGIKRTNPFPIHRSRFSFGCLSTELLERFPFRLTHPLPVARTTCCPGARARHRERTGGHQRIRRLTDTLQRPLPKSLDPAPPSSRRLESKVAGGCFPARTQPRSRRNGKERRTHHAPRPSPPSRRARRLHHQRLRPRGNSSLIPLHHPSSFFLHNFVNLENLEIWSCLLCPTAVFPTSKKKFRGKRKILSVLSHEAFARLTPFPNSCHNRGMKAQSVPISLRPPARYQSAADRIAREIERLAAARAAGAAKSAASSKSPSSAASTKNIAFSSHASFLSDLSHRIKNPAAGSLKFHVQPHLPSVNTNVAVVASLRETLSLPYCPPQECTARQSAPKSL